MTTVDYVAQAAELLGQHELAQRYTVLDDVCRCGTTVKDHRTHLAEVLAAAGLIPTSTEWGVSWRGQPQHFDYLPTQEMARFLAGLDGAGYALISRAVTDWKDASDD